MSIYSNLIVWWVVFFVVHSTMASSYLKNKINELHPVFKSYYRLIFNLVSTVLLLPIAYEYFILPAEPVFTANLFLVISGSILALTGIYIVIDGFKNYRTDEFIGTYQIKNHHDFHPTKLSRSGWNGIVRHPLYFGGILLLVGLFIISPTIKLGLTAALAIIYLYIGSLWEEKKLKSEFGDDYAKYKQEVSMLIPLKWVARKITNK